MKNPFRHPLAGVVALAALAFSLAGCESLTSVAPTKRIDYKSSASAPALELPPDLTTPRYDDRYQVTTATGLAAAGANKGTKSEFLPQTADAKIVRAGNERWLIVKATPEQAWNTTREFWQEQGFVLAQENPQIGVMQTDFAENRADIPADFLRRTVGKYLDVFFSTYRQDQFKTRIERGAEPGTVEIYVSHRGMEQVPTGKIDNRTRAAMDVPAQHRLFMLQDNQPRIEAYGQGLGGRNILVNIPSVQLELVELGKVYARHNICCGKLDRPTPTLASKVTDVTFNPTWSAPASIVEKDIIPKYLKDPGYLDSLNIHVFDGVGGPEIDPSTVDWENTPADRYHFLQAPGDQNALATVKVNFKNPFMVYMHDTPHRELFAQNNRYQSSGCVRVENVRAFINWILAGQDGFDEAQFEMITATQETTVMPVHNVIDVRFMYLTAWATEDGHVNFRPDVYQLDGAGFIYGQPDPVGSA